MFLCLLCMRFHSNFIVLMGRRVSPNNRILRSEVWFTIWCQNPLLEAYVSYSKSLIVGSCFSCFRDKVAKHRSLFYLDLGPQHWDFVRQLPKHVRHYIAQNKYELLKSTDSGLNFRYESCSRVANFFYSCINGTAYKGLYVSAKQVCDRILCYICYKNYNSMPNREVSLSLSKTGTKAF